MTAGTFDPEGLSSAFARHGLIARGGFRFDANEPAPAGPSGLPARSVVLVGHAGGAIWPHFSAWLDERVTRPDNPLDAWSVQVIGEIADAFGARAVFPSQKPYQPFQQWAMRAEGLKPSPLGMLPFTRNTGCGMPTGVRCFLMLKIQIQQAHAPIHPCDGCVEKPCLSACPVDAFSTAGFDAAGCRSWLDSTRSHVDSTGISGPNCMSDGCRARDACPVGRNYLYSPEQVRFHMRAFALSGRD